MNDGALESIGDLPETWSTVCLGDIATSKGGFGFPIDRQGKKDGEYPFFKVSDMNLPGNEKFMRTSNNWIDSPTLKELKAKTFPRSAIVFPKIGAALLTNKKRMLVRDSVIDNNVMAVVVNDGSECLPEYLYHWFLTLDLGRIANPGTVPSLTSGRLEEVALPLPPLPEQRKIAAVLGLVQREIEQQERLIALTTELKQALLHKLFTEGLRGEPQKQTEIGPVPESWELVPLGSLAKVGNGSTPKRDKAGYWQGGTIPWLNSTKIHERFITDADQFVTDLAVKECHLPRVKPSSLLVAITGQGKTLGNSALVSFETCINQHLAYAQFTTTKVFPEFVLWFMQTRYEHLRSISQAGGSTKGALTCGYLKTYLIPVPSLGEQREIADVFAALDRKQRVHERKHAALTDLFRSLLHQLMTAQIRVQDLDLSLLTVSPE